MGCLSNRKKQTREFADQKWDYINLNDFKAKGCGAGFAYGYLWFSLILSVVVYGVDTFTAVNLLAFNRWSSQIEPAIPIDVSKWIFSGCIILSFINLAYEYFRAMRVMKRGNVAECYLDTLAARWQCIRVGSGQGWRRFLVFAELTKSKKGSEYVALFTYFSFQSWIRVLLCSGPRQVVNAFTLKSVYEAKLSTDADNVGSAFVGFFDKIKTLAEEDYQQAAILSGMCFTFVVWVFSALFLLVAVCFYVFFLFHWIPRADGGLSGYCERKVNKKLLRIVTTKVTKALAKGQANRMKAEVQAARRNGEKPQLDRAATLPTLPDVSPSNDDSLAQMPVLDRTDSTNTLPPYMSRPDSPGSIELRNLDQKRPVHSRTATSASDASYSANAPLIGGAAEMGVDSPDSRTPTLPDMGLSTVPPPRPGTANSQRSVGSQPGMGPRMNPNMNPGMNPTSSLRHPVRNGPGPMNRPGFGGYGDPNSNGILQNPIMESPAQMDTPVMPPFQGPAPSRTPVGRSMDSYGPPMGQSNFKRSESPAPRQYMAYNPDGRSSPAPSVASQMRGPPGPRQQTSMHQPQPPPPPQSTRSATGPIPPRGPQYPPQRNMTGPVAPRPPPGGEYFDRTTASPRPMTPQGTRGPPIRSATGPIVAPTPRGPPREYDVEGQYGGRPYR